MSEQNTVPPAPQVDGAPSAVESVPDSAAPQKSGGGTKKVILGIAGAVLVTALVGLGVVFLKGLYQDETANAKAGDCIAQLAVPNEGETSDVSGIKIVDCASPEAKFNVIGRVEDKTKAQFDADSAGDLKTCVDAGHKDSELMIWSPAKGDSGYLLCLTEKK